MSRSADRKKSKAKKDEGPSDIILRTPHGETADDSNSGIVGLFRMHRDVEDVVLGTGSISSRGGGSSSKADKVLGGSPGRKPTVSSKGRGKSRSGSLGPVKNGTIDRSVSRRRGTTITDSAAAMVRVPAIHVGCEYNGLSTSTGEPMVLSISLYSNAEHKVLTEDWVIPTNATGGPTGVKTLFKGLSTKEVGHGKLYVLARIFRVGPLIFEENKDKERKKYPNGRPELRRPVGVAVASLDQLIDKSQQQVTMDIKVAKEERDYANIHKSIIKNATGRDFDTLPRSRGLSLTLHMYHCDEVMLSKAVPQYRQYSSTKKIDFGDGVAPGEDRHDLYLTLSNGDFPDAPQKSVQVRVFVHYNEGNDQLPMCISSGGDQPTHQYVSYIVANERSAKWNETMRLMVPADLFDKTHIVVQYLPVVTKTSAVEQPFGFSFIKLLDDDGTALNDGDRKLPVYKGSMQPAQYLSSSKLPTRRDTCVVRVRLRSTKVTQNPYLKQLLSWKERPDEIAEVLRKFTFIDQFEIVKFLREIFDALFAILAERAEEAAFLVYDALVFIIGLLVDDKTAKFQNFRPILDNYIEKKFTGATAHNSLVQCLKYYLRKAESTQHAANVRSSLKALEYIFKFIVQSRLLYDKKHGKSSKDNAAFKNELYELLAGINELMARSSPDWVIGSQILTLKYFASVFHDLSRVFKPAELSRIAIDFLKSVKHSDKKNVNLEKLYMLRRLANTELFLGDETRHLVMPELIAQLKFHFKHGSEEAAAAVPVVSEMIDSVQKRSRDPQATIKDVATILPLMIQSLTHSSFKESDEARSEAVTAFLAIFQLMSNKQLLSFYQERTSKSQFLSDTFKVLYQAQEKPIYPSTWIMIRLFQYRATMKILQTFAPILRKEYSDRNSFVYAMFDYFFKATVSTLNQDLLRYEGFPSQKRAFLSERFPEKRHEGAEMLKAVWDSLGREQSQFLPAIVAPFLELASNTNDKAQAIGFELYGSLLEREFKDSGSFQKVARRTFDALQNIMEFGAVNSKFRERLVSNLEQRIKRNQSMAKKGTSFINDLNQLIGFMMALRSCPATPEFEDERTLAMLKLMTYLKKTDRMDMYVVYVEKLRELHTSLKNYTEAGLTLLLYAHLLPWSDQKLEQAGPYQAEPARVRKEKLIRKAIALFDQGKTWERAIALIRDLRQEYENRRSPELKAIMAEETTFLEKIMDMGANRFFAEYFRVAYYGKGFPQSYQNKEFVYRGLELERLGDFIARIGRKFPNAEVLKLDAPGPPPREIINSSRQYLQITKVEPSSKEQMKGLKPKVDSRLPQAVQKYVLLNDVNVFKFERPWTKAKGKLSDKERIRYTYSLVTYLVTQDTFPSYLRRSEVVERYEVELSPVEVALNTIQNKNDDLVKMIGSFEKEGSDLEKAKKNINQFTMQLNGVIDAAVAGGAVQYRDIFFTRSYADKHPDKIEALEGLRSALREQVSILQRGLMVHRRICPPELMPLQEKMEKFFGELKKSLGPIINRH